VVSGRPLHVFEGHTAEVTSVAWSPDGKQALTDSQDGTARLWLIPSRLLVAELTRRLCYLNAFSEGELRNTIPNWRGCPAELAAVADDLTAYDALRPRQ
jgi:WD40 repeat protein